MGLPPTNEYYLSRPQPVSGEYVSEENMPPQKPEAPSSKELSTITTEIIVAALLTVGLLAIFGKYISPILDFYGRALDFIYSMNWPRINFVMSIVFSVINLAGVIFLIRLLQIYAQMKHETVALFGATATHIVSPKEEVKNNWLRIQELMVSINPSDWNMAVLHADSLLDDILIRLGYQGETMADRLKIVDPYQMPSLDRIWSAHRLRNSIAHDPGLQNTRETIEYAVKTYEQAFQELGFMEKKPVGTP